MKKILCLLGGAMLCTTLFCQKIEVTKYYIDDRIPDIPLINIVNFKDSITTLSALGQKLIILDFWGPHCGTCIAMFPLEEQLQKKFKNDLQFLLISPNSRDEVELFINNWNQKHEQPFTLPSITAGTLYNKLFWKYYYPHYVWIAPNGTIIAQTSDTQINAETIAATIKNIRMEENKIKNGNRSDKPELLQKLKLTPAQYQYFKPAIASFLNKAK
ncbi:TlpA family protein disulfide reductase [Arachidicoccus ginsenosidivorans]|jgi:thiol-disulfide isomerase/thioredoxin|nr:thioredoxin family protein [Arachidicoccus ginsenosidivorans]